MRRRVSVPWGSNGPGNTFWCMQMAKTVWSEQLIAEAISRKERGIRLRKLGDGTILRERERFYGIYRSLLMANEPTTEYYVTYKAYDNIAKERGLL